MNMINWWVKHPEVVGMGQCNVSQSIRVVATRDFEPYPLPDEWAGLDFKIEIVSPLPLVEDLEF